jgi:hypothetical protein
MAGASARPRAPHQGGPLSSLKTLLCVIVATVSFTACDENLSSIAGPDTPDLEPTFSSVRQDILTLGDPSGRRGCTTCHTLNNRPTPAGLLNMDVGAVYAALVNVPSRLKPGETLVIPGDPDNSYLIKKLEGRPGINGGRMPLNGPYLSPGQIAIIRRWIELGADNN